MKPKKTDTQRRIFETPLDEIINMELPLVILSRQIDWASLKETFGKLYVSHHGRPGLATRLLAGRSAGELLYVSSRRTKTQYS